MKNEYILYILIRNDLPSMNAGKAMAQASHASNSFVKKYGAVKEVKEWASETSQGFGTVIVLSSNKKQLDSAVHNSDVADIVIDPTYPYIVNNELAELIHMKHHTVDPIVKSDGSVVLHRKETTCGYVFGTKEQCKSIIGHLPLHP